MKGKKINAINKREDFIASMYDFGSRGIWDYNEHNRTKVPPNPNLVKNDQLVVLPSTFDVFGFDHPRKDIQKYKNKSGDDVYVGNDSTEKIRKFGAFGIPVLNKAFTEEELKRLNVYYEYPSTRVRNGTMGQTDGWIADSGIKHSTVGINRECITDEPTIVHETIHAIRFRDGKEEKDIDTDEARVELETVARVSRKGVEQMRNALGYYSWITNGFEKMKQDRVLLTGGLDKNLTGETAVHRVEKMFPHTNIARLKIGAVNDRKKSTGNKINKKKSLHRTLIGTKIDRAAPEWLDRTFEVVLDNGDKIKSNIRFNRPIPIGNIVHELKIRFGNKIREVREWRDGKRVRVYLDRTKAISKTVMKKQYKRKRTKK